MDLATQERILEMANGRADSENVTVLLGAPDAESSELSALTVISGDPTYAGALAGVQLGLPVYHVLEEAVEQAANAEAYEEHIGLMADVLETTEIRQAMDRARQAG
jgi:glycine reductase